MSTIGKKKKRPSEEVLDGVILVAKVTKDIGETLPVLAPLKGAMGILITILENAKKARTNADDWETLAKEIKSRLESIQDALKDKTPSPPLQTLVTRYSKSLEGILGELNPLSNAKKGSMGTILGFLAANTDSEKINDARRKMGDAYGQFTMELNLLTQINVEEIHGNQKDLHQEQLDTRKQIDEIEAVNLLKGVATAYLANGGIHKRCMKDTRHSILEEIEDWLSNPDAPQVLWLADVAGAGKSTVAKEVAEKWKAEGVLAGRFFFSRDAEETRTPKLFFTTIAQQGLAQLGEDVRSAVALGIRKLIDPVSATLEDQCTRIFVEPLQVIQEPSVLVLDALDECEPKTCQQLLDILLPNLPNIPHLKLFVTSRPESHIQRCLNEISLQELSLRSNKEANSKDVEHYMNQKLVKISIPHDRKVRLVEQAGGLFIWARTVCDLLENCGEDNSDFIDRVLSQKVEEMDAIYRIALEQTIGNNKPRETIKRYMNVLHVIVATFEPVTPDTVNKLLNISGSTKIIHDLRSVLECGGTDEVIRFLHPTFREFLLNQDACRQYYVDIGVAHSLIAEGCLSIMEGGLKYDLCRLYDVYNRNFYPNELEDKCATLSGALQYSCNFWAGHIIPHSGTISSSISSIIEGFLASKLLDWIYVIAAQGSIDKALTMLRKLISLESTENVRHWSRDASRFLQLHWNTFRSNPLRVYHQFAFSPRSSIFHQIYSELESFPHPVVRMGLDLDWPSSVTVQTYYYNASCLSPCQGMSATGGKREGLPVYSIWDVRTGDGETFVHPCKTNECGVYHVSFTHQGDKLILRTGCECGQLCLWDISSSPHSLLDERRLGPKGRYLWWADDASKVVCQKGDHKAADYLYQLCVSGSPSIHHDLVWRNNSEWWFDFSPGIGEKLVSYPLDYTYTGKPVLTLWECSSGGQIFQKPLEPYLASVEFSPNGTMIAITTQSHILDDEHDHVYTLELIRIEDGLVLQSRGGIHTWNEDYMKITFFPDGDKLILWDYKFIHLFDAGNWQDIRMDHLRISISPDGKRIAIISKNIVDIFDSTLQVKLESYKFNQSEEYPIAYRWLWAQSTLLVSGNGSRSLHHLSHDPQPNSSNSATDKLLLSPDSRHLLTVHETGLIYLWDVQSGHQVQHLNDIYPDLSRDVHIKYAPNSSCALLWNEHRLMIVRLPTNPAQFTPAFRATSSGVTSIPYSTSKLLNASFFTDSNRILMVESDGKVTTLSLHDMAQNVILTLCSPWNVIRQLEISPTGRLAAISSDIGLTVHEIIHDIRQISLPSTMIYGAGFSPNEAHVYMVEFTQKRWMVSRVDILDCAIHRICVGEEVLSGITPMFRLVNTITGDGWSILKFKFHIQPMDGEFAVDLSSGKLVRPSSLSLRAQRLEYEGRWLMYLFGPQSDKNKDFSIVQDHLAYISEGRAIVLDLSSLVTQALSVKDFKESMEVWKRHWLRSLKYYPGGYRSAEWGEYSIKENLVLMRKYGTLEDILSMIEDGEEGKFLQEEVQALRNNVERMQALRELWKDENLTGLVERFLQE